MYKQYSKTQHSVRSDSSVGVGLLNQLITGVTVFLIILSLGVIIGNTIQGPANKHAPVAQIAAVKEEAQKSPLLDLPKADTPPNEAQPSVSVSQPTATVSAKSYAPTPTYTYGKLKTSTSSYTSPSVYTPFDCDYRSIPYATEYKTSSLINAGDYRTTSFGFNGSEKICYTYGRAKAPTRTVTSSPVNRIVTYGTYVAPTYTPVYTGYVNSAGNYVPSPSYSSGASISGYSATAICQDGTYSYSQSRSGTCSHHGGVSSWR